MQSLSLSSVSSNEVLLKGEGLFYNPNSMSLTLQEMNVKLFVNDEEMGVCQQELNQKIKSKSDFTVPIEVKFPPDKLYKNLFQGLLGMLTKQEYEVRYVGEVKMKAYGVSFTVPVDEKKKVKF
jgi:LEA14-like dessication related protein